MQQRRLRQRGNVPASDDTWRTEMKCVSESDIYALLFLLQQERCSRSVLTRCGNARVFVTQTRCQRMNETDRDGSVECWMPPPR